VASSKAPAKLCHSLGHEARRMMSCRSSSASPRVIVNAAGVMSSLDPRERMN
jgi:hypothetical protein